VVFVALHAKRTFSKVALDLQIPNEIQFAIFIGID